MADRKQATKTESAIAGGALVISIAGGDAPRTWRADMSRLSTAVFELEDDGAATLLVMKSSGAAEAIHAYPSKAEAAAGLQSVTEALLAQPSCSPAAAAAPQPRPGAFGRILRTIFYLFLALICAAVLIVATQTRNVENANRGGAGVPMTADQMLGQGDR